MARKFTPAQIAARRERQRRYIARNRERILARKRAYWEANRERLLAAGRAYRAAHREKLFEQRRAYRERNAAKLREKNQRYRTAIRKDALAARRVKDVFATLVSLLVMAATV